MQQLLGSAMVDEKWLLSHVLLLETLSFAEQVRAMSETDLLVSVHGASLLNGVFMRRGSAVIQIMTGRFMEYNFAPALREAGVELLYLPVFDQAKYTQNCPGNIPEHCLQGSLFEASAIDCYAIRQCSVTADSDAFHSLLMQAYHHVLSAKFMYQANV